MSQQNLGFKRSIGLFMAVMIGIGAMMGPGIFALPGESVGSFTECLQNVSRNQVDSWELVGTQGHSTRW